MTEHIIDTKIRLQNDSGKGGDWYPIQYTFEVIQTGTDERDKPEWGVDPVRKIQVQMFGKWHEPDDLLHDMIEGALHFADDELLEVALEEVTS